MKSIIYSIFIDIPEKDLDNTGWYDQQGVKQDTDKSKVTKNCILEKRSFNFLLN